MDKAMGLAVRALFPAVRREWCLVVRAGETAWESGLWGSISASWDECSVVVRAGTGSLKTCVLFPSLPDLMVSIMLSDLPRDLSALMFLKHFEILGQERLARGSVRFPCLLLQIGAHLTALYIGSPVNVLVSLLSSRSTSLVG